MILFLHQGEEVLADGTRLKKQHEQEDINNLLLRVILIMTMMMTVIFIKNRYGRTRQRDSEEIRRSMYIFDYKLITNYM